jgi:hypothetical protein
MTFTLCVGFMSYKSGIPQLRSDIHAIYNVYDACGVQLVYYDLLQTLHDRTKLKKKHVKGPHGYQQVS